MTTRPERIRVLVKELVTSIIPTVVEDSLYNTLLQVRLCKCHGNAKEDWCILLHSSTIVYAAFNPSDTPPIEAIAIDYRGYEALLSLGSEISASNRGIARINNRLFHFEEINPMSGNGLRCTNGVFLKTTSV